MKVLAIGGSGGMGRKTVRTALTYDFVTEIIVAGVDGERAERFVKSLNDSRVKNLHLDVTDRDALHDAMRSVDVILNSAGPFFRFGYPILEAAIEMGCDYCDICDDWEPTEKMLTLKERAAAKGVTAIIGLGASPGIANMLGLKAGTALDEVDELVSAWKLSGAVNEDDGFSVPAESGAVDAAAVHLMHCLAENIRVVRDGKFQDVSALEASVIDYPGVGPVDIWSIGHPEAITFPRRFKKLKTCYNGMLGIETMVDSLREVAAQAKSGKITLEEAAASMGGGEGRLVRNEILLKTNRPEVPSILAYAKGRKNGKPARAGASIVRAPAGGMAASTGVPHALFLPLLQQGLLNKHGVFAPEEIVDPDAFFALLDGFCGPEGTGLSVQVEIS